MSPFEKQMTAYELDSTLHKVAQEGFGIIRLRELYRLTGRGNRSQAIWRDILDAWEALGYARDGLYITELTDERVMLVAAPVDQAIVWAGEVVAE